MANTPAWFNKDYYLTSKLAQLRAAGETKYNNIVDVAVALEAAGFTAYEHFQQYSLIERTSPNPAFNATEYLNAKAAQLGNGATADSVALAIREAGMNLWEHFQTYGWKEGVNPSNSFDVKKYMESKLAQLQKDEPDAGWTAEKLEEVFSNAGIDPVSHYDQFGKSEEGVVVSPAENPVPSDGRTDGEVFTLTTGVDNIVGTAGNDTINGVSDGTTGATLQSLDAIDGGAGTDTLTLTNVAGTVDSAAIAAASVKNVENLSILSGANGVTADVSKWAGLETVTVDNRASAANSITTDSNVKSVSVKGGTTAFVTDNGTATDATADTLTAVTLDGLSGGATVESDALTSLTLNNLNSAVDVTAAAGTRALTVTLNNVGATGTAATVTDNEATTVTVNTTGKASANVQLVATKATALTVNADEAVSVSSLNVAAKTITIKGDSLVTIGTAVTAGSLESISSVDSTGGVTIGAALGTAVSFTGGAGKDTITLGATTKAITTGAGDDNVTVGSSFGTGGSVDAGEGTDTLTMTAANAIAASSDTVFETKIAGFEKLSITGTATGSVNLANLDDINYVKIDGTNKGLTLTGLTSGATLEQAAAGTAAVTTVAINAADTNTADVLNLLLTEGATGTGTVGFGSITANNVETIKITTDDTATTATGNQLVGTLVDAAATSISVAGDAGLDLTFTGTKLTSFDASGVTKGAVTFTTGALEAAATIKGGADGNTFNITAATKAVSVTGGAKVDSITIGASGTANNQDNTVATLDGGDNVTIIGGGKNTIDLGAGDDTLTIGHTGATGITSGLNVITLGEGKDTVNFNVASTNGNTYTTITDFQAGDKLAFSGFAKGTEVFNKTAITLGGTAAFADFLNAAAAGDGSTNSAFTWFQYSGDTYLVMDNSAESSYQNGVDSIVKLTGLVDLSKATFAAGDFTAV